MTARTAEQMRAQWLLAGRLTGLLSIGQMLIFTMLMIRLHSVTLASVDFWLLILGFAISGVCATVCLSRSQPQPQRSRR
jgi:membrane protein implicated in regulation of membrane protease activity